MEGCLVCAAPTCSCECGTPAAKRARLSTESASAASSPSGAPACAAAARSGSLAEGQAEAVSAAGPSAAVTKRKDYISWDDYFMAVRAHCPHTMSTPGCQCHGGHALPMTA